MSDLIAARRAELRLAFQQALEFSAEQSRRLLKDHPGYYPMYLGPGTLRSNSPREILIIVTKALVRCGTNRSSYS